MITEREMMAYIASALCEFDSMCQKFGATTRTERVKHETLKAGFRDGLHSMAAWLRSKDLVLSGKPGADVCLVCQGRGVVGHGGPHARTCPACLADGQP